MGEHSRAIGTRCPTTCSREWAAPNSTKSEDVFIGNKARSKIPDVTRHFTTRIFRA